MATRTPPVAGAAAHGAVRPRGLRHLRMALGTTGEFRPLRRATKGPAFGNRKLLKKLDQNFYLLGRRRWGLHHLRMALGTIGVFRALRGATKGPAFGNRKLLKKLDQNF